MPSPSIEPPPYQRLAMEQLSIFEYGSFLVAGPMLALLRKGDGHPVLVIPGFASSDRSTEQLRAVLRRRGHDAHGWRLGRNVGPHAHILEGTTRRLVELHGREGRKVSLVGWSLGGIYARELAREHTELVRQVITMASPFRFRPGDRGNVSDLYDAIGPRESPFPGHAVPEHHRPALDVPATSIYTRTDGIVRWHACIESAGARRENIEVLGTHTGLGYNLGAAIAVADRLACPEGRWVPFRPRVMVRHLFPRPVSWAPAADDQRWVPA